MNRFLALLACWLALASIAHAQGAPAAETLAGDTPRATGAGTTFTAPAGWTLRRAGDLVVLDTPEGDSHVALLDVEGKSGDEAVASTWAAYRPEASPLAPRNGWDERRLYEYETSPNERAVVYAVAVRRGPSWLIALVDATEPTFEKRGSQASLLMQSLRPKGYERESFAGRKAHALTPKRIAALKSFVAGGMQALGVPGVGLAFIDGGKVVYEGGLGTKQLGTTDKVDANTLFIAASNTKAMTTLLLAELVDAGKLRWDEPVTQVDPSFKLGDAATTRQVLVKHLICACTGMPRQDLEWLFEYRNATPESSIAMLGTMQPTSRFGEVFQYSNLMAAAAGYLAAHVIAPAEERGAAYDRAMHDRVFAPLGMTRTTFDFRQAMRGNYAKPHGDDVDGHPARARMDLNYSIVPVRPAGGVWTSAHDLARYVQMELANGKLPNGRMLVSARNLLARREAQTMASEDMDYGMGLTIDRRWGIPVVHHGGDLAGYHSDMMWLPDYGVGAVILTNSDPGYVIRGPLLRKLLELLFDGRPEADAALSAAITQYKAQIAKARERLVVPADATEAAKLAAHYRNASLGTLDVRREGNDWVFDVGEWHSVVASRRNDDGTISFITIDPTISGFEFVVGVRDGHPTLTIRDAQHEYVFTDASAG